MATVEIEFPPLRERVEDIPLLAEYFFEAVCGCSMGEHVEGLVSEALEQMQGIGGRAIVRELKNVHPASGRARATAQ